MEYIAHRINTVRELLELDSCYGVELDLRDGLDGRVYIQHEPFVPGEDFEMFLRQYHHGTMILNVKSERIEYRILELLGRYHIRRYFFLDSTFPMMKALSDIGERCIAVRFSEFEGMDTLRAMAGRAKWVWVDCFSKFPLDSETYREMKALGYNICIVSPELEGQPEKISQYKAYMLAHHIVPEAICAKQDNFEGWK